MQASWEKGENISDSFCGVKAEIGYKSKYLSVMVTLEDTLKG